MAKLQLNDDGTITFPLKGREPVTLDEPSMDEMADFTDQAQKVDDGLIDVPTVAEDSTPEVVAAFNTALIERTRLMFGHDHPYGDVVLAMVNALGMNLDVPIVSAQLYGWAMSPRTVRMMLEHYRSPLPGPVSEPT